MEVTANPIGLVIGVVTVVAILIAVLARFVF